MPVFINQDITLMKISQVKNKRAAAEISPKKQWKDGSHGCQGGHLRNSIAKTLYCIWLVLQAAVMKSKCVHHIRVSRGVSIIASIINNKGADLR
ncbi:predicted protein [Histoplasma mississippiense (nom. inval.)]|uniref:predicted protein n=1 Tax=Ajellomyces capsulatus (strain NAm1 / WU24) TaxID=2059318 RepID=UPI000157D0CE|nr:predicted protein [Histoplasma mississippiense (nom. inval.)]EDN04277.1 predicted protein [Histoplasma mississippiense (nom. inval.)]